MSSPAPNRNRCPECYGTGKNGGFNTRVKCEICNGTGASKPKPKKKKSD